MVISTVLSPVATSLRAATDVLNLFRFQIVSQNGDLSQISPPPASSFLELAALTAQAEHYDGGSRKRKQASPMLPPHPLCHPPHAWKPLSLREGTGGRGDSATAKCLYLREGTCLGLSCKGAELPRSRAGSTAHPEEQELLMFTMSSLRLTIAALRRMS